jgi:hypothetical protein
VGGEAATVTLTGLGSLVGVSFVVGEKEGDVFWDAFCTFSASFAAQRSVLTVGAALKCVMFSVLRSFQIKG